MTAEGIDGDFTVADTAMLNRFLRDYFRQHGQGARILSSATCATCSAASPGRRATPPLHRGPAPLQRAEAAPPGNPVRGLHQGPAQGHRQGAGPLPFPKTRVRRCGCMLVRSSVLTPTSCRPRSWPGPHPWSRSRWAPWCRCCRICWEHGTGRQPGHHGGDAGLRRDGCRPAHRQAGPELRAAAARPGRPGRRDHLRRGHPYRPPRGIADPPGTGSTFWSGGAVTGLHRNPLCCLFRT